MNVKQEINQNSDDADKKILLWLFGQYHMERQWNFVARCEFIKQDGKSWVNAKRKWTPTREGRILAAYAGIN